MKKFYVKKGLWPVTVAGDNTTYYVVDREDPEPDATNPDWFTNLAEAQKRADFLNSHTIHEEGNN